MATMTLTIELGNDAMRTGADIARALRSAADYLDSFYEIDYVDEWYGLGAYILDLNGNRVGRWGIEQ